MSDDKKETRYVRISKKLYDEIRYAQDNLNRREQLKIKQKKRYHSLIDASYELGSFLNSQRKQ